MIQIYKNREPQEWTRYKSTPGVVYSSIPELVKSLYQEQGYICAYCMRRIPCKDGIGCELTKEDHRVEHIKPREVYPELQLDYTNMVVCCPGRIGDQEHCDRLKGKKEISFSPLDSAFISTLSYNKDGTIVSSNKQYDKEINEVLNLNTKLLKLNRKQSWEIVVKKLVANKDKQLNKAQIKQYIAKYSSMHNKDGQMKYIPYCGVVLYNLNKKLRKLCSQ